MKSVVWERPCSFSRLNALHGTEFFSPTKEGMHTESWRYKRASDLKKMSVPKVKESDH